METSKELVKKETPPSFIEKLMLNSESLDQVKEVGMVIIKSGFCPDHFKQSQDAVGVIMCIEAGRQLGLTWMQSLSDLYPVKGRIGMMGAAARSLIFSSGILDKWEELTEGDYPEDTYKHIIISKRKGLPGEFRSEFSVHDAKKAGLFQKDIYQRYGKRMIMWRNIGFHATDYYGDIMKGMKTVEELNDFDVIPGVGDTIIEKEDGKKIKVVAGAKQKSGNATENVTNKISGNRFAKIEKEVIQEATVIPEDKKEQQQNLQGYVIMDNKNFTDAGGFRSRAFEMENPGKKYDIEKHREEVNALNKTHSEESPFIPQRGSASQINGEMTHDDNTGGKSKGVMQESQYSAEDLEAMPQPKLMDIINGDMDMQESVEMIPGKNTKKKLKEIILAHQDGSLAELVAREMPKPREEENKGGDAPPQTNNQEIKPNVSFDQQGPAGAAKSNSGADTGAREAGNKYNLDVPKYDKNNQREFSLVKVLFNKLMGIEPQITTSRYMDLSQKLNLFAKYPDKEAFLKFGTIEEINLLLNSN